MGQATADLPNSTEAPAEPTGNADELLSQLAGEEIDRLLAEADAHPSAEAEAVVAPAVNASTTTTEPLPPADPSDPTIREMAAPVTPDELDKELAETSAARAANADPFDAQVNQLFNELKEPEEKPPAPAAADVPPVKPLVAQDVSASAAIAAELEESALERAALQRSAATGATPAKPHVEVKPSILVRLLEIINLPVNAIPDSVRDTLGRVAILTSMNSLGVLLYMILFRK